MKETLQKISELHKAGVFTKYAIGGGIAHFYYIEAGTTYDLDVMIQMNVQPLEILSLQPLYDWAKTNGYESKEEHIIIEGIPVQFLPAFNPIIVDAIESAVSVTLFDIDTFIMKPEYLMVIMLQTGRPKDKQRFIQFISQVKYSSEVFLSLVEKYNLNNKYDELRKIL